MAMTLWQQLPDYTAKLDRQLIESIWTPGVVQGLEVTTTAGVLQVNVSAGIAVVKGMDSSYQGSYLCLFQAAEVLPLPARPGSGSRIDVLAAVVTDTVDGAGTTNEAKLLVYSGNPSTATPIAPSIPATAQEISRWTVASTDTGVRPATMIAGARSFVINTIAPGSVQMFAGDVAPLGWLFCRGAQVSRQTYARLFTVIGTRFGAGDGTTTFHLPNYQATFPVGFNTGSNTPTGLANRWEAGVGQRFGFTDLILPAHNHRINDHRHNTAINFARYNTSVADTNHYHKVSSDGKGWIRRGDEWYVRVVPKSDDGAKLGIEDAAQGADNSGWMSANHRHTYDLPAANPVSSWHGGEASPRDDLYTYVKGTEQAGGGWVSHVDRNIPPGLSINFIIRT